MSLNFICGDCLDEMKKMDDESIDIIVTSPPYNIKKKYNTYDDNKSTDEYLNWMENLSIEFKRILKQSGSIFLNIGSVNINPWLSFDVANKFRKIFFLQNHIIWVKSLYINGKTSGHFKPINSERFLNNNFEDIFHFTKDCNKKLDRLSIGVPFEWKSNLKKRSDPTVVKDDVRCRGNLWYIPYNTIQDKGERFYHPSPFPIDLPKMCIKLHGVKNDMVVLDPFIGSGNTLIACNDLNVNGIGIDIDERYITISKSRINDFSII